MPAWQERAILSDLSKIDSYDSALDILYAERKDLKLGIKVLQEDISTYKEMVVEYRDTMIPALDEEKSNLTAQVKVVQQENGKLKRQRNLAIAAGAGGVATAIGGPVAGLVVAGVTYAGLLFSKR